MSYTSVYQQAFERIYSKGTPCAQDSGVVGRRYLELSHFPVLSEVLRFSMEDLSLYILPYMCGCTSETFLIPEKKLLSLMSSVGVVNADAKTGNSDQWVFKSLRKAIERKASQMRSKPSEAKAFYYFLYQWCLKNYNEEDRTTVAVELWQLFFFDRRTPSPTSYAGYAEFTHLQPWIEFVQTHGVQRPLISADTWNMLLEFASVSSYESYNPNDSWPVAIDDFVTWYTRNQQTLSRGNTER